MQLVIAEKPSVARSIAEVIGAAEISDGYMEGEWLSCELVRGASGGTGTAGKLRGTVEEMDI